MHKLCQFLALVALAAAAHPLLADGVGTSVFGSMTFVDDPFHTNLFLPGFFTQPGFGNHTSDPTTIGPDTEFGFFEIDTTITADFGGTTLFITDLLAQPNGFGGQGPIEMEFIDSAFTGFTQLTNNSGIIYFFSGDPLTVVFPGTGLDNGTFTTTFSYTTPAVTTPVAATPEPSGILLIGTGALGIIGATRRKLFNRSSWRR